MADVHRTRGEAIEGKPRPVPPLGGPWAGEDVAADLSPADLLGLEHDLIHRVVTALARQSMRIEQHDEIDRVFLATVVDFLATYAGRVHHGKEEEILFRELHEKPLSAEDRRVMEELARDHVKMRSLADDLQEAEERYREGDDEALRDLQQAIDDLADIYPDHMEAEDEDFFPTAMGYLENPDREQVLEQMRGHDRAMIHDKYGSVADELDARTEEWALRE